MIDFDVISEDAAQHILAYLIKVKDRSIIGDIAWCEIALSVLNHLYFSDFNHIGHQVLVIGIEKSTHLITDKDWRDKASKLRNNFESIQSHFDV